MSQVKSQGSRFGKLGSFKFKPAMPAMPGLSIYVDRVNIYLKARIGLVCLFDYMT